MMPREQRVSRGFQERLNGTRDDNVMLYGGGSVPNRSRQSCKRSYVPSVPNDADGSLVAALARTSREQLKQQQLDAVAKNIQFQEIQKQKDERVQREKYEKQKVQELEQDYPDILARNNNLPRKYDPTPEDPDNNFYSNFGKPGGGAPQYDADGNLNPRRVVDPNVRSTNPKAAQNQGQKILKLEKETLKNSMNTSKSYGVLDTTADYYDPWGKGAGNPFRTGSGKTQGMKRADPYKGIYVPGNVAAGTGLITESRYGGGGGQPRLDADGNVVTTKVQHFAKDAHGNDIKKHDLMKTGEPFGPTNPESPGRGGMNRGDTFASFQYDDAKSANNKRYNTDSPLEKEAQVRRERMERQKRMEMELGSM